MKTEESSPRYSSIDCWEPGDILESLIEGQFSAVAAVRAALPAIRSAAVAMEARLRERGRLVYAGAGTSGRLAVQDGTELTPTFGWPDDRMLWLIAGGKDALLRSVEGAEDDIANARQLVGHHGIGADDVLVAVAASGTTPFTLECLRTSRTRGALTVGIANNQGTPILAESPPPNFSRYWSRANRGVHKVEGRHRTEDYAQWPIDPTYDPAWKSLSRSNGRRPCLK